MLNSPAFESRKCLPRTGLPRSSFIIPPCSQPHSDPVWVIINCSQHSPACSSLAHRPPKLTAPRSLFLLIRLFWKEERKESNFQRRVGVFFSPFPPLSILRGGFTPTMELPQKWVVVSILHPQSEHRFLLPREEAQPCSTQSPQGGGDSVPFSEGFVPPAWRASCPKCHPRPSEMDNDRGCWMKRPAGRRCRIFSLQNLQGKLWGLFPLLPGVPGWRGPSGDRARLGPAATVTDSRHQK